MRILVSRLFENVLHRAERNIITFSRRGKKTRQHALRTAIEQGADRFRRRYGSEVQTEIQIVTGQPSDDPLLQVVDYANWAVYRAFERDEMRYFEALRNKFSLVQDVFDREKYKGGANFYNRNRNPFDINKISPLG